MVPPSAPSKKYRCVGRGDAESNCPLDRVLTALESPVDFPPLSQAVVPGDHVAVAVDPLLRHHAEFIAALVKRIDAEQPASITVVFGWDDEGVCDEAIRRVESALAVQAITDIVVHDPDTRDALAYLAADTDARPIYLNRQIVEADWVLPVSVASNSTSFPRSDRWIMATLADRESMDRFNGIDAEPSLHNGDEHASADASTADTVDELAEPSIGYRLGIQLVAEVFFDDAGFVERIDAGLICPSHKRPDVARHETVVATLDGPPESINIDSVRRAVTYASDRTASDGSLRVCMDRRDWNDQYDKLARPMDPEIRIMTIDAIKPGPEHLIRCAHLRR